MGNTFITPVAVARDAAIASAERLVVGNLVSRDKENMFTAAKVGDEVKVTVPPAVTDASEFTGSTAASDQTEVEVGVKLEKHFYKRIDLTSKQKSLELSDFTRLVTVPAVTGIMDSVDKYILRNMQVFRRNLTGTVGNRPSTMAHIAAATKKMNDLRITKAGRVALIDTTAEESFSQLSQFQSQDYGPDAPAGLREAILGRRYGFNFQTDVNAGAFDRGDIAGTLKVSAEAVAGATSVVIKAFSGATGTVKAGTVFVVAGDTTRYVVRKDAAIAGNVATVEVYPAVAITMDADDAVTVEAAGYSNLAFHPGAVAAAIVAPTPLAGGNSVVQSFNGVSIRVSMDSSIVTLSDSIVYDVFVGARVIQPDGGALFCG
jgi:hypothetical protein